MDDLPIWYKCDPAKATTCKKSFCKHNKNAKALKCESTKRKEWAVLDAAGNPVVNKETMQKQRENRERSRTMWAELEAREAMGNPVLEGEQPGERSDSVNDLF